MIRLSESDVGTEELKAVEECFDRQWLGNGPKTSEFELQMAARLGVWGFVFVNSGSNALQLAVHILDLPPGSEIIVPSLTWMACANAVLLNGLVPVFCDVDVTTANITDEYAAEKVTKRTAAIMVVHYAGKPVDMDSFRSFGLPLIEDAAHAIDSRYRDHPCGTIGDAGVFSFDAMKNLTTGEGGGVIAKDLARLERARQLRYCGVARSGYDAVSLKDHWWEYDVYGIFPKLLNTDIAAAIGLVQLDKLKRMQDRRKAIWEKYSEDLESEDWLGLPLDAEPYERHSYFTYQIRVREGSRDQLAKYLYDRGIYTTLRFQPLHLNRAYNHQGGSLPNCEWLNEVALNLPMHSRLTDEDVDRIVDAIRSFGRRR